MAVGSALIRAPTCLGPALVMTHNVGRLPGAMLASEASLQVVQVCHAVND